MHTAYYFNESLLFSMKDTHHSDQECILIDHVILTPKYTHIHNTYKYVYVYIYIYIYIYLCVCV